MRDNCILPPPPGTGTEPQTTSPKQIPTSTLPLLLQHLSASLFLCQSVFKNYDPEQEGYISQEDFETISTSFPFSFYGLDRDR